MKSVLFFVGITFIASPLYASVKCKQLKAELLAMKSAQNQIMMSLVNNHETFAASLEEYSDVLEFSAGKPAVKAVSQNMIKSASSFRTRGVQGKKMVKALNRATADLVSRVASCL